MNIGRVLFIAIFLFSSATLLTVSSALEMVKNSIVSPWEQDLRGQKKQLELEQEYKENLLKILETFNTGNAQLTDEQLSNFEEELLSLTVPAELKDLHFELVASLALINQKSDESDKEIILQKIERMLEQYSWLTSSWSMFLMNNF
ncbi:hypothetical protein KJ840_04605 [Patescibacteria group bacterium]|nr:hypothetical protein [Patescibacteria group bacterium]